LFYGAEESIAERKKGLNEKDGDDGKNIF